MPPDEITNQPQQAPKLVEDWFVVEAKTEKKGRAAVRIYDAIGGWYGVRTSDLVKQIEELDVDELDVYVNSPGGQAFDGLAIMNVLQRHKAAVTIHVDGLAASAASMIVMGGDTIVMGRGAQMMIHDASMIAWGPPAVMAKAAETLNKLSDSYADVYAKRAGGTAKSWRTAMIAETWYTAEEAVKAGLADRTLDAGEAEPDEDVEAAWANALTIYRFAGRSHAPEPARASVTLQPAATAALKPPAIPEPGPTNRKEEAVASDTLVAGLRERLGITDAETDEDSILATLDERLAKPAAPALPDGVVAVEQGVLDGLKADAAAGRQAREQQIKDRRDGIVAKALREGRIKRPAVESFRALLDKDEAGTAKVLEALEPDTAVPVNEIGSSLDAEPADDAYPSHWITKD